MGFWLWHRGSEVSSSLELRLRFVDEEGFTHPQLSVRGPNLSPGSVGTTEV